MDSLATFLPNFLVSLQAGAHGATTASFFSVEGLVALLTLTSLEIVLGIDNVIFLAIIVQRLPLERQAAARRIGVGMAVGGRILLLLSIRWVMGLTEPLFSILTFSLTGRDLILLGGGLFLIAKATYEIHDKLEGAAEEHGVGGGRATFAAVIAQALIIDLVFSLDSVITAVGLTTNIPVMVVAILLAAAVMLIFAAQVSSFVHRHPTMKMLALSFLVLVGVMLVAEGLGQHIERGYVYFAMAFSFTVELLNMRLRPGKPVELRHSTLPESEKH